MAKRTVTPDSIGQFLSIGFGSDSIVPDARFGCNCQAYIYPIVRQDGRELYFTCTEGKYTYPDFQVSGEPLDWGTEGAFLAVLEPPAESK